MYIHLVRRKDQPLTWQLYSELKRKILSGELSAQYRLPSTRQLANELSISRNTVILAYDQLIAEGFLHSKNGSGTYVCSGLSYKITNENTTVTKKPELLYSLPDNCISFRAGVPDLSQLSMYKWGKLYQETTCTLSPNYLDYQNAYGAYPLRKTLASYLTKVRGVSTNSENIIITNGAAQAFNLLKFLLNDNENVLIENPSSIGLIDTLISNKINYRPVPVDDHGIMTTQLPFEAPKLIFTTPSHQFPTGSILPINRRIELIKYALEKGAYIIEDDYDSEFRYTGAPIQSLQSLEPSRVIYIGSFSKSLTPAIRMGYMILPETIIDKIKVAKYISDIHSPILEQLTMSHFIENGFFERHIYKMSKIYAKKRAHVIKCLSTEFGNQIIISGANAGLHLVATFKYITFDKDLLNILLMNNLYFSPLSDYYSYTEDFSDFQGYPPNHSLIIGYGNVSIDEITLGIKRLSSKIRLFST